MSSLIGASLNYGQFHATEDSGAFVLRYAGLIAGAFLHAIENTGK